MLWLQTSGNITVMPSVSISLTGKKAAIAVVAVVALAAGAAYVVRTKGVNLHIKSGQLSGNHIKGTTYLDGQIELEGELTSGVSLPGETTVSIDQYDIIITQVSEEAKAKLERGARIRARLARLKDAGEGGYNETYIYYDQDPFYLEVVE